MIRLSCENSDALAARVADAVFVRFGLTGEASAELVYVSEEEIRDLNRSTRGVDRVTDVLSFPSLQCIAPFTQAEYPFEYDPATGAVELGSIVICTAVAERQAKEYGHSPERERGYLFLHGLLHLLGYDHIDEAGRKEMRTAEEAVLSDIGLTRE